MTAAASQECCRLCPYADRGTLSLFNTVCTDMLDAWEFRQTLRPPSSCLGGVPVIDRIIGQVASLE